VSRRKLANSHPTYKAFAEVRKAEKTIFLCECLVSLEVHEGLNVVENWNATNDFICYGRQGELATRICRLVGKRSKSLHIEELR
jgi:TnpA family transposase